MTPTSNTLYADALNVKQYDIVEVGIRTYYPNNTGNKLVEPVIEIRSALITRIEMTDSGINFIYVPCERDNTVLCGFGSVYVEETGPKPFGWQSLKVVGHQEPRRSPIFNPRPGDTGYDLMC